MMVSEKNETVSANDKKILGIHHVTAIASDPQANIEFYTKILGLRLVKLTINYDDPGTYHLYYGDKFGMPGSILTFFPWPNAHRGTRGTGQATVTSFSIPENSIEFWIERFRKAGVIFENPTKRFSGKEEFLTFYDSDDLKLELVVSRASESGRKNRFVPWEKSPVPVDKSIMGFHSVTISEEGYERTASLLTDVMGFQLVEQDGDRFRYESAAREPSTYLDVLCQPELVLGQVLAGTVHHVAWRTPNEAEQKSWRQDLIKAGRNATPVIDRQYFHSVYFREPGGVLFEIATDPPSFTVDEQEEQLGTHLKLPSWLESSRKDLEDVLPRLTISNQVPNLNA